MASDTGYSVFYPFLAAAARVRHVMTLRATLAAARAGEYVAEDGSVIGIPSAALEESESVPGASRPRIRASISKIPRVRVRSIDAVALVSERTIRAEGSKAPALVLGCTPAVPGGKAKSGSFKPEAELCRRSNMMICLQGLAFPLPQPSAHFLPRVTAFRDSAAQHYRFLDNPHCFAAVVVPASRHLHLALRAPVPAEEVHSVEDLLATAPPGCPVALAPSSARYVARVVCAALALAQRRGHTRVILHAASLASKVDGRVWLPHPELERAAAVGGRGPESSASPSEGRKDKENAHTAATVPAGDEDSDPAAAASPPSSQSGSGPSPVMPATSPSSSSSAAASGHHPTVWVGHLSAQAAHAVAHAAIARITAWLATRAFAHALSEVSVCLDPAFVPTSAPSPSAPGLDAAVAAASGQDVAKTLFQRLRGVGEAAYGAGQAQGGCPLPPDVRRVFAQFEAGLMHPAQVAVAAADDACGAAHALLFAHHGPEAGLAVRGGEKDRGCPESGAAEMIQPVAGAGAGQGDSAWQGESPAGGTSSDERSNASDDDGEEDGNGAGEVPEGSSGDGAHVLPFCARSLRCGVSVGQMSPEWIDDAGHLVTRPAGQVPGAEAAVVGPFELLRRLGTGAEGEVHSARHVETNELFALKAVWLDRCFPGSQRRRHLAMQLDALRALPHHHGLVGVAYVDEEVAFPRRQGPLAGDQALSPAALLVMPVARGGEVLPLLRAGGCLPLGMAALCTRQLCEAVDACHRAGVIHRDLKPDNLLFSLDGRLQVADFGFATVVGAGNEDSAELRTPCGTRAYMAPEVRGGGTYQGARSDAWSVGVVAFIFVAGVPPVAEPTRRDWYFRKLLSGRLDLFWAAHERHTSFFPAAKDFLQRALAVDPASRLTVPDMLQHPFLTSVPPLRTPARREAECAAAEEVARRMRCTQQVDPLVEAARELERRRRCPPSAPAFPRVPYDPDSGGDEGLLTSPPLCAVANPGEADLYDMDVVRGVGGAEEAAPGLHPAPRSTLEDSAPSPPPLPSVDIPALAALPGEGSSSGRAEPGLRSAAADEVRTVEVCSILEADPAALWESLWRCAHTVAEKEGCIRPVDASHGDAAAALARLAYRKDQVPLAAVWSVRVEAPQARGGPLPAEGGGDEEEDEEERLPAALPSLAALTSSRAAEDTLLVAGVPMGSSIAVIRAVAVPRAGL